VKKSVDEINAYLLYALWIADYVITQIGVNATVEVKYSYKLKKPIIHIDIRDKLSEGDIYFMKSYLSTLIRVGMYDWDTHDLIRKKFEEKDISFPIVVTYFNKKIIY
jgi:hypothetical protein